MEPTTLENPTSTENTMQLPSRMIDAKRYLSNPTRMETGFIRLVLFMYVYQKYTPAEIAMLTGTNLEKIVSYCTPRSGEIWDDFIRHLEAMEAAKQTRETA